jgi:hypothetical protein
MAFVSACLSFFRRPGGGQSWLTTNKQSQTTNRHATERTKRRYLTGISERLLLRVLKLPSHHSSQALRVVFWFWAADPQDIMTTLGRASGWVDVT